MAKSLVTRTELPVVESKQEALPLWNPFLAGSTFLNFTHSYSEISQDGARTHIKSTTTRLTDGRLSKESFEGDLPAEAFGEAVIKAQTLFLEQAKTLLRPWWLPAPLTRLPVKSDI